MRLRQILVIHPVRTIRNIIQMYAFGELNNVMVQSAATRREGLALLEAGRFDLVISGDALDNGTGLDLMRQVSQMAGYQEIPFLMVVSQASGQELIKLREEGVKHLLAAPFSSHHFADKVNDICNPESWRKSRRYNVPASTVSVRLGRENLHGRLLNLSLGGLAMELPFHPQLLALATGGELAVDLPAEFESVRLEGLFCQLNQLYVVSRDGAGHPESVRLTVMFTGLDLATQKAMEAVFLMVEEMESRLDGKA